MESKLTIIFSLFLLFFSPSLAISGQVSDFPSHEEIGRSSILLAEVPAGCPYQFDQDQISRLNAAGCLFNDEDLAVANRMLNRKFSAEEFVVAYEQAVKMNLGRDAIEIIATFQLLFLPTEEYGTMKSKGMSVTDYYNNRIGGQKMIKAGSITSIISIFVLFTGFIYLSDSLSADSECDDEACGLVVIKGLSGLVGIVFIAKSSLGLITGISLIAIGKNQKKHWAKDLDSAPKDEMEKYRLSPPSNSDTIQKEVNISPENTKLIFGISPLIAGSSDKPNGVAFTFMF